MELPVGLQLRELELALALGAGLSLLYALLGPLRRGRLLTALLDLLYVLAVLVSLLAFALYAGRGRLRIFALAAMALSGALGLGLWSLVRKRTKNFAKSCKKSKKTLAIVKNSGTMK